MAKQKIWNVTWSTNFMPDSDIGAIRPFFASYLCSDFESAKEKMFKVIELYTRTGNKVFDENGGMIGLDKLCAEADLEDDESRPFDEGYEIYTEEEVKRLREFPEALRRSILSEFRTRPDDLYWCGSQHIIDMDGDELHMVYSPMFGVQRMTYINLFDMSNPEKDYYFAIDNVIPRETIFGEDEEYLFLHLYIFCQDVDEELELDHLKEENFGRGDD